jgi:hypothetical protein
MALREHFRIKRQLDMLAREIGGRLDLPVGQRKLNKEALRRLLAMTTFEPASERDLELYVRPLEGETKEVVVIDNDLPIYHSTVQDVGLRKTPSVKEMISIRNIRKILDDKDVVVSRGMMSLRRIYGQAYSALDFSYTDEEIASMVQEGSRGLRENSLDRAQENLEVFLEILGYREMDMGIWEHPVVAYAVPTDAAAASGTYRDLILFDREELTMMLIRGEFSPQLDSDLDRLLDILRRNAIDAEGGDVFGFLGRMAKAIDPERRRRIITPLFPVEEHALEEA